MAILDTEKGQQVAETGHFCTLLGQIQMSALQFVSILSSTFYSKAFVNQIYSVAILKPLDLFCSVL